MLWRVGRDQRGTQKKKKIVEQEDKRCEHQITVKGKK